MNRLAVILGLTLIACGSAPRPAEPVAPRNVEIPRVLFVDHWPRWEFRFIKDALIKDGAYRAQILLTSAEETFPQDHSPGQDAVKYFPDTLKELLAYDVLILGDVPLEKIGGNEGAAMIVNFVKQGRGLILLAGTENNPHKYAGTPLEAVLPVDGDAPLPADQYETGWPYKLTDAGRAHVVTTWEKPDTWEGVSDGQPNLQRVRFYAVPRKVKEGAVELVRLHNLAKETTIPLFVTMNVGAGRVFFSATDETYRWRYMHGNEPYFWPFWKRAIAWAAKP